MGGRRQVGCSLVVLLVLSIAGQVPSFAQVERGQPARPGGETPATVIRADAHAPIEPPEPPSFREFGRGLLRTFGRSLFTPDSLAPLMVGAVGAAAIGPFDLDISARIRDTSNSFGEAGNVAGGTVAMIATTGGLAIASRFTTSRRFRGLAFAFDQAVILETVIVQTTKLAVGRQRPDRSDRWSFPSGHSAGTFTLATVVSHYYGWKWGAPFYGLAGLVALSRIEQGKHWPSDVVAGAAIGVICGRAGIRTTDRLGGRERSRAFSIRPYAGPGRVGVQIEVLRGVQ